MPPSFTSNAPPPLPPGPLWERLILENPWPTAGVLAVLAVAALVLLSRVEGGRRVVGVPVPTAVAALLVLAGCIVLAVGMAVTTDREELRAGTQRLVDATAARDLETLDRLLASEARLHLPLRSQGLPGPVVPREQIMTLVEEVLGRRYPLKEHRTMEVQAALDGPRIARTQVRVRVVPEAWQIPHTSWWRVDWRREEHGGWRVIGIEPLDIPGARLH
jgi:hypothetical protein